MAASEEIFIKTQWQRISSFFCCFCHIKNNIYGMTSSNITYSYSQKYFAFLKLINFKEKMLREGIILKYFSYILINIIRGTQI